MLRYTSTGHQYFLKTIFSKLFEDAAGMAKHGFISVSLSTQMLLEARNPLLILLELIRKLVKRQNEEAAPSSELLVMFAPSRRTDPTRVRVSMTHEDIRALFTFFRLVVAQSRVAVS
ncbi:hypothetical protein MKEN_01378400 [Mycena kentingensis (nom. inval.)]|nr:hypothetical protein MKEN_01378400 [Mycena kentingensis (nom. inval.)]